MQPLRKPRSCRSSGHIRHTLATLAAGLLSAAGARAEDQSSPAPKSSDLFYESQSDSSNTSSRIDGSILFYQETGRVQAIEPSISASLNMGDNHFLSLRFTSDSVTGATPNGAVPSDRSQNFVTPIKIKGSTTTGTTASGGSTIIQLPPTPGQIAQAAFGRQYTIAPNTLPVDAGFHDQRFAGDVGWAQPLLGLTNVSVGAGYSTETDYQSITMNSSVSQDFNEHNSTVSLAASGEFDRSDPFGGTPTPLTPMSAQWKGPGASRTVLDFMAGFTQVMNRYWLALLNYSYGTSQGYNTDPYRIVSVVDATGEPVGNLYESRPDSRTRQSVYLDNKVDLDRNVVDVSFRYFWDTWGVHSTTLDVSDRYALTNSFYVQPQVRWYRQTAASFYRPYLVNGAPLPAYVSSDSRLGAFTGMTYGAKVGYALSDASEINIRGMYYNQSGNEHPAGAIGQLAQQNLLPGLTAVSVLVGFSLGF